MQSLTTKVLGTVPTDIHPLYPFICNGGWALGFTLGSCALSFAVDKGLHCLDVAARFLNLSNPEQFEVPPNSLTSKFF
jgi:hypothetical protein